jgi:hypothetical protein
MGLFFVPGVNIPLIYFFALVTLPFSFVMGFFAPDGFEKHFDSALIMVYPTDVIGWFFFGAYLLIFFNFYTFIYLRQSASRT